MTLNNKAKENIIKESTKLIQKKGYVDTSIQDIIKKSKAPKGSLYYYFPKGKDDIILATVDKINLEFTKKLKDAVKNCENFGCVLLCILNLFKDKEKNYGTPSFRMTLLALETIGKSPEVSEKCGNTLTEWKEQIEEEIYNKLQDYKLAEKISEWFFSSLQGSICASVIHKDISKMELCEKSIELLSCLSIEKLKEIFK